MNIKGKRVLLRSIEREDLLSLQTWFNDPDIQNQLGGWHFPVSAVSMEQWFESWQADELNRRFAIETEEHGIIGTTNLVNINWKDRNAFTGTLIGKKQLQGQGYGMDTVMAIMRYAFEELGMERLDSSIIEYNQASYRMYVEKCGWTEEGRRKNWYWRKNRFWDKINIGINRDDYFALLEKKHYWE